MFTLKKKLRTSRTVLALALTLALTTLAGCGANSVTPANSTPADFPNPDKVNPTVDDAGKPRTQAPKEPLTKPQTKPLDPDSAG